jgi:septal ring factor EnvC (AmiA/AmiB activator)
MNQAPRPQNGILSTLAQSGNQWVQLGTLALVGFAGVGNWVATWNSSDRNKEEIQTSRRITEESEWRIKQELVRQVAEIHNWMKQATEEFHQGNADSSYNRQTLEQIKKELEDLEKKSNEPH